MHHGYVQTLLQPGADRGGLSTQHGNVPSMPGQSTTLLGRRPLSQQQYLALLKQSNGNHEELGDGGRSSSNHHGIIIIIISSAATSTVAGIGTLPPRE